MEAKQYATKQPMDHWRNQTGNQKIPWDKWTWKQEYPKAMAWSESSSNREIYSNTILPQETRKISNKQPNLTPKATREKKNKQNPKLVESNHKDKNRNKWNRDEENHRKDQWN